MSRLSFSSPMAPVGTVFLAPAAIRAAGLAGWVAGPVLAAEAGWPAWARRACSSRHEPHAAAPAAAMAPCTKLRRVYLHRMGTALPLTPGGSKAIIPSFVVTP
jgi:hypothetical protein